MRELSKLPERLKFLMQDHDDIKSDKLGKLIGISGTALRFILRGESLPSLATAIKLADFFECSLDYLSGIEDFDRKVLPRPVPPFYDNLRRIMKELGISRYYLAHTKDFRDSYFVKWSRGEQPKLLTVCTLAEYLNVSLDYLVGRTDY